MPIAAKLSRRLYETFGDEAAEAMVDWMVQVEAQRAELRELNDANFARIDARFGEFRQELRSDIAGLRADFAQLREEMRTGFAQADAKLERRIGDLMKWSLVFWIGSTVTLVVALASLGRFVR